MKQLERLVFALEWLAAILLIVLALISIVAFFVMLVTNARHGLFTTETVLLLLDELLVLFLLVELIKMAFAYMHGENIIPVALEAVVIALARKAVALDFGAEGALKKSGAIALLTLAVGISWFLISRAHAIDVADASERPSR